MVARAHPQALERSVEVVHDAREVAVHVDLRLLRLHLEADFGGRIVVAPIRIGITPAAAPIGPSPAPAPAEAPVGVAVVAAVVAAVMTAVVAPATVIARRPAGRSTGVASATARGTSYRAGGRRHLGDELQRWGAPPGDRPPPPPLPPPGGLPCASARAGRRNASTVGMTAASMNRLSVRRMSKSLQHELPAMSRPATTRRTRPKCKGSRPPGADSPGRVSLVDDSCQARETVLLLLSGCLGGRPGGRLDDLHLLHEVPGAVHLGHGPQHVTAVHVDRPRLHRRRTGSRTRPTRRCRRTAGPPARRCAFSVGEPELPPVVSTVDRKLTGTSFERPVEIRALLLRLRTRLDGVQLLLRAR